MLFNVALFSSLFLAPVVLAVPSGLGTPIARRRGSSYTDTRVNNLERAADQADSAGNSTVVYSDYSAGATWIESNGTFTTITGTFAVPTPLGSNGASASAWIGIGDNGCTGATLQTGVVFTAESDGPAYSPFYSWLPGGSVEFAGLRIVAGDILKLTVTISSPNNGTTTVENLTNGRTASRNLSSSIPLCGQTAEWVVQASGDSTTPLADFGNVTFTDATAYGNSTGITYTPEGARITDIKQNNTILTSVSTSGDSVMIQYITQNEKRGLSPCPNGKDDWC